MLTIYWYASHLINIIHYRERDTVVNSTSPSKLNAYTSVICPIHYDTIAVLEASMAHIHW